MGVESLLLPLGTFWLVVHAVDRWRTRQSSLILPLTSTNVQRGRKRRSTHVVLRNLSLRIEYSGLNHAHDALTSLLGKPQHTHASRILVLFYDLGTVLAVLGMVSAILILAALTLRTSYSAVSAAGLWPVQSYQPPDNARMKRDGIPEHLLLETSSKGVLNSIDTDVHMLVSRSVRSTKCYL